jgi:hypothetical protein
VIETRRSTGGSQGRNHGKKTNTHSAAKARMDRGTALTNPHSPVNRFVSACQPVLPAGLKVCDTSAAVGAASPAALNEDESVLSHGAVPATGVGVESGAAAVVPVGVPAWDWAGPSLLAAIERP